MHSAIRHMQVLPPELVPSEEELDRWRQASAPFQLQKSAHSLSTAVDLCRDLLKLDVIKPFAPTSLDREDDAIHDSYFNIGRVAGDNASVMIRAVCQARLFIVEEIADPSLVDLDASWRPIDRSLAALLQVFLGGEHFTDLPLSTTAQGPRPLVGPMTRWIGGHQIFAVLTQGLIFSMRSLARSLRAGEMEAAIRHAELSVNLLHGSASTFRFTGEFLPEEYSEIIRPSMMPPATAICLSGLMSVDHRYFVQQLREMRPALKQLREQNYDLHDVLATSLSQVYDAHVHVCERFVGDKPSIRTAESTDRSGPALLQQFKNLRLKPFEHA